MIVIKIEKCIIKLYNNIILTNFIIKFHINKKIALNYVILFYF
jgi:hypothetical protein